MYIDYSPEFKRLFNKLPKNIQLVALRKEKIFRNNIHDPRLRTHKLGGKLKGKFAFSVSYSVRILFSIDQDNIARFHSIGTHDIYK